MMKIISAISGLSILVLIGCGQVEKKTLPSKHETPHKETIHEEHSMKTLSVEKRIAFMSGHVEAGLALYRAGKPDQAAKHLMHPVSEMHQEERTGIDSLGFKPEVFKAVSKALDEGKPASKIETMLTEAENNITLLQKNAGGNEREILLFLMDAVVKEYQAGVIDGKIVEAGEYQDAFGFSVVALKIGKRMSTDATLQLTNELSKLVAMWPEGGPVAAATPEPFEDVVKQTEQVIKTL